ncbi:MAG TPA: NAD(P)-binding domain-containing protein, partial [Bacillales bacterium]|nr:NAD(P)-binding domain-containing protein [Bacillales bacterium]
MAAVECKIGLVGIGNMGYHFARRLLENGCQLVIHDKDEERLKAFESFAGAEIVHSPKHVADEAEIVFVSLPTPSVVSIVALGEDGLIHGEKMKTYVDLSTTGQSKAKTIAAKLIENGIAVLDSPVSGGVPGAEKGTLAVMVSGAEEIFTKVEP